MNYHLSTVSGNAKTGPIAVTTSSKLTCPDSCPHKNTTCYAAYGPLNLHWNKVTTGERGDDWETFLNKIRTLWKGSPLRYAQAGDLPGENEKIDSVKLKQLSKVIKERKLKAWAYTHKKATGNNLKAIRATIKEGFIINVSTDSFAAADKARKLGLPTVVVLPEDAPEKFVTPAGNRGIVCPAQTGKTANCASCLLCQKGTRSIIVGFLAHGTKKKLIG